MRKSKDYGESTQSEDKSDTMHMLHKIRHLLPSEGGAGRSLRAGGYLAAGSVADNALRFLRNIILARMLAPEAFGLMATLIACAAAMEAFTEVGLRQSVIQNKKGGEKEFLNIAWFLSFMRGCFLYFLAFLASPFICDYFSKPEALAVLRVGFLPVLLNAVVSPRFYLLEKELRFRKWVAIMQAANVFAVVLSVYTSFFFHDVWPLIIGYVGEAIIRCILSFVLCPFLPGTELNPIYMREILTFSRRMFGLPILMMLFLQADTFVIGRVLSLEILGMYYLARDLAELPNKLINRVGPLFLPTLALIQDDPAKLKQSVLDFTKATATFGIPFIVFFMLFSRPILSLLYGTEYSQIALPFSILCSNSVIIISSQFIMNIYIATGKPHIHRKASVVRTLIFLLLIYPATSYYGLIGASLSALASMILSLSCQLFYLRRLLRLNILDYLHRWLLGIKLALFIVIPWFGLHIFDNVSSIISTFIGACLCVIAWIIGITVLKSTRPEKAQLIVNQL